MLHYISLTRYQYKKKGKLDSSVFDYLNSGNHENIEETCKPLKNGEITVKMATERKTKERTCFHSIIQKFCVRRPLTYQSQEYVVIKCLYFRKMIF